MSKQTIVFSNEQIDHICFIIGEWYVKWKRTITVDPESMHRLGYAKEDLKEMLFPVRSDDGDT
jgi:hypothetical protein